MDFKNKINKKQKQKVYIVLAQASNPKPLGWQADALTTAPARCILTISCFGLKVNVSVRVHGIPVQWQPVSDRE